MLTLNKKMSHVTLIGTFSYKGTQGQTAAEPVWAFKMGRHETLSCCLLWRNPKHSNLISKLGM